MLESRVRWADFTFPPLNLWNMQLHSEIVKLINQYYYEHYKYLWEEDQKEPTESENKLNYKAVYRSDLNNV